VGVSEDGGGIVVLSETAIRALKPKEKPYKRSDEKGLFMLVSTTGARLWRLKYRHGGKEKLLALGSYPEVSLKRAREKRDEARVHLADGRDPSALRATAKADNFEAIAREWLAKRDLSPGTIRRDQDRLEQFIFPRLGNRPVRKLTAAEILAEIQRIEERGTIETAHRTLSLCSQVMRYAVQTQRCERDVTGDIRGALATRATTHYPAITEPRAIGGLLRMIDAYVGLPQVMYALRILPYVFVRPSELRRARWPEFDLDVGLWTVPAERMKGKEGERKSHLVPLARQVIALLKELKPHVAGSEFLFPSPLTNEKPISNIAMNAALRRMGVRKDEHCPHGFRSTASTRLNELGFAPSDVELQLAHKERDKVRAAYNRAARLKERTAMMQFWADYLDGLRADKVLEFSSRRKTARP
jgi:integrase